MSFQVGDELGPYVLEQKLGEGRFGEVWRARHSQNDEVLALRVLSGPWIETNERRQRIVRAGTLWSEVRHPSIPWARDTQNGPGWVAIAYDLVQGRTLRDVLRAEGRLTPERTTRIASQLLSALSAAEARGVHHLGLTSRDLILEPGPPERVHLLDLGLTQAVGDSLDENPPLVGAPDPSTPPEQLQGLPLDGRSDQFSAAAILYECATGHATRVLERVVLAVRDLAELAPELAGSRLHSTVMRALEREPDARFPSVTLMLEALEYRTSDVLIPCPTCQRHIRTVESGCPFCDAEQPKPEPPHREPVAPIQFERPVSLYGGPSMYEPRRGSFVGRLLLFLLGIGAVVALAVWAFS